MTLAEINAPASDQVVRRMVDREPASMALMGGGRNNRVYRVDYEDGSKHLAKFYPQESSGSRDRLASEINSLGFLWKSQVRCIPQPVSADEQAKCGIFEYIDGTGIDSTRATAADVDQTIEFVKTLNRLHGSALLADLPLASDACFSFQDLKQTIDRRYGSLEEISEERPQIEALAEFLRDEFFPCYQSVLKSITASADARGLGMADVLGPQERTLSPSDFGFHNAIKRPNGQIVFIDFEYFGWDDPAKMISDYLLHPAQDLNEDLRQRFFDGCLDSFADWPGVSSRMDLVYPLCGLKWCLLLLNEFLPRYIETREHAHGANLDVANLQSEQLAKSQRMLARVKAGHEPPY